MRYSPECFRVGVCGLLPETQFLLNNILNLGQSAKHALFRTKMFKLAVPYFRSEPLKHHTL